MSSRPADPIIIIGCPRSGTTLLRRLLDAHDQISCPGESFVLRGAARFIASEKVAEGIEYGPIGGLMALGFPTEQIFARLREFILSFHRDLAEQDGKPRIAIKTAVDSFYVKQIYRLFKGHAKFVFLTRHGADVALSLREFGEKMEGAIKELLPFIQDYHRFMPAYSAAWAKITSDMLDIAEADHDEVFAARYEDLVKEPEQVLDELFGFLDIEADSQKLIYQAFSPREVRGLGDYKTFTTRHIDASKVGRWKELPDRVLAEISPILNPSLNRLSYPEIDTSGPDSEDAMRMHELAMMYQASRETSGQDG